MCRKLWTSYGFGTNFLPFFEVSEQVWLQLLCKFFYEVALSRVATRVYFHDYIGLLYGPITTGLTILMDNTGLRRLDHLLPDRLTCAIKAGKNTIYDHGFYYWSRYRFYKPTFVTSRLR